MLYNEIFDQNIFQSQKAIRYGFQKKGKAYCLTKPLPTEGFLAEIKISAGNFEVNVLELPAYEPFLPFNVPDFMGAFLAEIRAEVAELVDEVLQNCFETTNMRALLLNYLQVTYGTVPEMPWAGSDHCTLKTAKKQKWYGILMRVPYRTLGLEKKGKIDVINLKAKPEQILKLIDHRHYFPAYHMNKKHWLSILLDTAVNLEEVKGLIDESYHLVESDKKQ